MKKYDGVFKDWVAQIRGNVALVNERDALMNERDALMNERDALMNERDALMNERNKSGQKYGEDNFSKPDNNVPTVLLNTLPKSASVYILETLAKTLSKPVIQISPGYFPSDYVDFRK